MTITHETVRPPSGVRGARYRPPSGSSDSRRLDLDGDWRFALFDQADTGAALDERGDDWSRITVPGHWQLAGAPDSWPYGTPEYSNKFYPFPVDPPRVPDENPTGEYRLPISLPADWPGQGATVLRFEGVDSWFEVALNGTVIATSSGSRLPTEIDVTPYLVPGENLLAVRVTKWSAFSYVEDQDQWWLSGIFRSVSLEHRPRDGVEHVQVHADYDHHDGTGTLVVEVESTGPARVRVPELGVDVSAGDEVRLAVDPWSAEVPRLYELQVSTGTETVTLSVGFRRIEIADGVFTVNGRPIVMRGVNRHEFDPLLGRALTARTMLDDVLLMKRHNVNAVRTSHYPPHPHFLDLCDRHGLWVIDENDVETHGFEKVGWAGNPVDDPEWEPVLVDRTRRMVRRDAHHPSIVLWSLGNEAGRGRAVAAMAAEVRRLDPSRPVHYEGDLSSDEVDVYSRMYATTQETELIGRGDEAALARADLDARRRTMPFLQCEYAHAMGNGPGGLADYDALFDRYPRLMGGFIWEWIDHGLSRTAADGTISSAYGGDFAEEFHNGTFIADGLLLPDRTPSPSLLEAAAVFAPVRLDAQGDGSLLVRNRYAFRDTSHLRFMWTLHRADETLASGELILRLEPGGTSVVRPPDDLDVPAPSDAPVWWTVRAEHFSPDPLDASWAVEATAVSQGQVLVQHAEPLTPPRGRSVATGSGHRAGGAEIDHRGRLTSLMGLEVTELRTDAWRAPTDNDRRSGMWVGPSDEHTWRTRGLDLLRDRHDGVALTDEGTLVVRTRTAGPTTECGFRTTWTWTPVDDGQAVDLDVDVRPEGRWSASVPRIGLLLALRVPRAAEARVHWQGLGPHESYSDSRAAALGGAWSHTVAEWQTPYTHPQENGARRGVTQALLEFADGTGLRLDSGPVTVGGRPRHGVELSLRPWSDAHLEEAGHASELTPDGLLYLHVDAASHGLGSAACGPGVLENARLRPAPVRMRLRLSPWRRQDGTSADDHASRSASPPDRPTDRQTDRPNEETRTA